MISETNRVSLAYPFLVFLCFLLFGACLVNLNGGDWDGVQIVLGSLFPAEAAKGYTMLYRPQWQPLTYGILRLMYGITHSVQACMFLPAVFGAAGITFYLGALRKVCSSKVHPLLLVGIVLLIPELLFGSIYMNSTVFGFAFAAAAVRLAVDDWIPARSSGVRYGRQFLAGGLLGLACLCRFDFLLACPMFVFLLMRARSSFRGRHVSMFVLGGLCVGASAWGAGMIDPIALLQIVAAHKAGTAPGGQFHYTPIAKALLALIGANLLVWLMAGGGFIYVLRTSLRQRRWLDLLGLACLVVLFYPAPTITTPKYLVPFYLFLGLFFAWTLDRIMAGNRLSPPLLSGLVTITVVLAGFLPVHPSRTGPWLRLTSETWRITDDGPRSFWGYVFALRELSHQTASLQWLDSLLASPDNLVLVTPYEGWLASPTSQAVVFHFVSHGRNVEMGPDSLWAQVRATKVLLTGPQALNANLDHYFPQATRPPRQATVPLMDMPADGILTLRSLAQGMRRETELIERGCSSPQKMPAILEGLVQMDLIESPSPGCFRLKHPQRQLRFYPDPTGGEAMTADECPPSARPSS